MTDSQIHNQSKEKCIFQYLIKKYTGPGWKFSLGRDPAKKENIGRGSGTGTTLQFPNLTINIYENAQKRLFGCVDVPWKLKHREQEPRHP